MMLNVYMLDYSRNINTFARELTRSMADELIHLMECAHNLVRKSTCKRNYLNIS